MLRKFSFMALLSCLLPGLLFAADLGGMVLKVGTDATYPPMETIDEATGEIVGFDVDVMNAICSEINCVPRIRQHGLGRHIRGIAAR